MDKLRSEIWDYLFQANGRQSLDIIAQQMGRDPQTIHTAIDHEWFDVTAETVAIAYGQQPEWQQPTA